VELDSSKLLPHQSFGHLTIFPLLPELSLVCVYSGVSWWLDDNGSGRDGWAYDRSYGDWWRSYRLRDDGWADWWLGNSSRGLFEEPTMGSLHMGVDGGWSEHTQANPADMGSASTRDVVTTLRLLDHNSATRAPFGVIPGCPFVVEAFLFGGIPLRTGLVTCHSSMGLLVTPRTDLRKAGGALVDGLVAVTLVNLVAVGGGAVLVGAGVAFQIGGEGDVDETVEPLWGEIALDDGNWDGLATCCFVPHTVEREGLGVGGRDEIVAKAPFAVRMSAAESFWDVDFIVANGTSRPSFDASSCGPAWSSNSCLFHQLTEVAPCIITTFDLDSDGAGGEVEGSVLLAEGVLEVLQPNPEEERNGLLWKSGGELEGVEALNLIFDHSCRCCFGIVGPEYAQGLDLLIDGDMGVGANLHLVEEGREGEE